MPADNHWEIFSRLAHDCKAEGKLLQDAYLAAIAIESDCVFVTADSDFKKFKGLKLKLLLPK